MRWYAAGTGCFFAAMVAFTVAGESRVAVFSPLGLSGAVLFVAGLILCSLEPS